MQIDLDHVNKTYQPAGYEALKDVSVSIASGEWVFLVGASGMGKTTLLKMLYKEERPDQGVVRIDRRDIGDLSGSRLRQSMGIIFQSFRLLPRKTAYENVAYGAEVLGVPPAQVKARTREILDRVGLGDKANRYPSELSGGEQQRVAVGRALVNRPKLLLADEPTGDLDPANSEKVVQILMDVHAEDGATIVFATHAVDIVDRLRRRVVRMEHGRIASDCVGGYFPEETG